ncbi:MAG: hypothetical protein SOR23_04320 [Candidatus Enterosoma sp.]|nr:hypothetical protein [Candidatus Enterosoma sp.]
MLVLTWKVNENVMYSPITIRYTPIMVQKVPLLDADVFNDVLPIPLQRPI